MVVSRVAVHLVVLFNATPATEIHTLSLHDALPIWDAPAVAWLADKVSGSGAAGSSLLSNPLATAANGSPARSEEHTSELQSQSNLVCRLLLEKKKRPGAPRSRSRRSRPSAAGSR